MGGGKGSKAPPVQKSYTSQLPEWSKPYYENIMARAETESNQPYIQYGGPRIAGFTGEQESAFGGISDLARMGAPTVDTGARMAYGAGRKAMQETNFNPMAVGTGGWNEQTASQYMNPYIGNVLNTMRTQATERFKEQQGARSAAARQANAFGGSRQAIQDYLSERDMNEQLNRMNAEQLAQAYGQGAQMFTSDQARALQADMANQQALERAAGIRLQGAQQGLAAAQGLGQLGQMQQGLTLDRLAALEKVGATRQGLQQSAFETAYKAFIDQRDYPKQAINWLTGIMAGVPQGANSQVTSYEPAPSPYSMLMGAGMAGNELSRLMAGSSRGRG